jgi:Na+/melibiose symporter-like transporter
VTTAAAPNAPLGAPARRAGAVPLPILTAFSLPGLSLAALVVILGVYLPRFYVGIGLSFAMVAVAIPAVRLLDVWIDPIFGVLMDRTNTPIGRYRPYLILGAPIAMFGIWKLLIPPPHPQAAYLIGWSLVTYVGVSALTLATSAWSAVLARSYDERARVWGFTTGFAVLGSCGILLLPVFTHGAIVLGRAASMPTICLILVVTLPIAVAICAIFTPEKLAAADVRPVFRLKDYFGALVNASLLRLVLADLALTLGPGTTAPLYVYFFHDAKGFTIAEVSVLLIFYIGAGIVGAPFWGRVAQRFSKHRTIQIACVCYGVAQTILMIIPRVAPGHKFVDDLPTAIGMAAVGFCASAFVLLIRAMIADVVDEVKLHKGVDMTSLFYSLVTTTAKVGAVITTLISFTVLSLVHYNGKEGAVNTPQAVFGLEMCYLFAPIILVFFGGAVFFGYKLDARRHAEIRTALEARASEPGFIAAEESLVGPVIQRA